MPSEVTPMYWPKDSLKLLIYINEEGIYELLFSRQQPKAKEFRKHCLNVSFPDFRQQLTVKLYAVKIEDLTNRVQALDFTNEDERQTHQQQILKFNEEHLQSPEEK